MLKNFKACANRFFVSRLSCLSKNLLDELVWCNVDSFDEGCNEDYSCIAETVGAVWCRSGLTKLVFYFKEFPEVVFKIPFCGIHYSYIDMDYSENRPFKHANECGSGFEGFPADNYCAIETELFNLAERYGIEDIFVEMEYLGDYNNIPIYISETIKSPNFFADPFYRSSSFSTAQDLVSAHSDPDNFTFEDIQYIAILIDQYGAKKAEEFIYFIAAYHISDLHCENVGWDSKGKFRILDYSGFRDGWALAD